MKRIIMLLPILGAAYAQADDSIKAYGMLDMYFASSAASGATRTTVVNSGGMQTSYWGFAGTEQLAGTLKAHFTVEGFLRGDTGEQGRVAGEALFARNAYVGLSDQWGEVRIGRISNPFWVAAIQFNPYGPSTRFSPLQAQLWTPAYGGNGAGDTGWSNAVSYTSPTSNNVVLRVQHALGETTANTTNSTATLTYNDGTVGVVGAYQRVRFGVGLPAAAPEQRSWLVGASYDAKLAKLYATYDRNRTEGTQRDTKSSQLGLSVPAGGGAVLLEWVHTKDQAPPKPGFTRNTAAVGYDYNLSKRTDAYVVYLYDKLSTASVGATSAVGLRHRF